MEVNVFDKIQFNRLFHFTLPGEGNISDSGVAAIFKLIADQRIAAWPGNNGGNYLPALPDEWEWRWLIQNGEYRGTFPKRAAQYWFARHKIKCPPEFLSALGNVARANAIEALAYHFDFTKSIDWEAGDFGDRGSCYWGSNENAREMVEENGAAIRFFDANDDGIGRAWFAPYRSSLIVFNGYGFAGDPTFRIAQIVAAYLNAGYSRVRLLNNGSAYRLLYINGSRGYIVGTDRVSDTTFVDLQWEETDPECESCGRPTSQDDCHYTPDGDRVCSRCFYEVCDYCESCGDAKWRDVLVYVPSEGWYVCERCFSRDYTVCVGCHDGYPDSNVHTDHKTNNPYCDDCYTDLKEQRRNHH